ncbi:MAG: FecR domain-containing protein [Myxococcota bacterium]
MRKDLLPLLLLLALLVAGFAGYRVLFSSEAAFVLVEATGDVRRTDALGGQRALEAGAALDARDRVSAGAGGRAVLAIGDDTRVTVEEESSVKVLGVDAAGVRLELEGGRVQATVRPGSGSVGIVAGDTEFTSDDADFRVDRDGDVVGVAVDRNAVSVKGLDGVTEVREGQTLVAPADGDPLLRPATEALLLYVADPAAARVRDDATEVRGKTVPGARVRVRGAGDWQEVRADPNGEWVARVSLAEGENAVRVEARDVLGNVATSSVTVVRDTTAPAVGVEVRF